MSITPRVLKEMAAGMAEGPLRTAKTIPLADALFDAAERIEHLDVENARLRAALKKIRKATYESDPYYGGADLVVREIARAALAEQEKKS